MRAFNSAFFGLILITAGIYSCNKPTDSKVASLKDAWNSANDPIHLGGDLYRTFAQLPQSGSFHAIPWADSYWPSNEGGIAARWNAGSGYDTTENFYYEPPTFDELQYMSEAEIYSLSPAEKLDIMNGDYSYPTVASERERTSPNNPSWWGICHGWAPASLSYYEPSAVRYTNSDGIPVLLGSSDIKALMSFYEGEVEADNYVQLGEMCETAGNGTTPECKDTNAGAFHVVVANYLGLKGKPFIADVTRDEQVWNQPVFKFSSTVESEKNGASAGAANGTVKEVTVSTTLTYRLESDPSYSTSNNNSQYTKTKTYRYRLELNSNGNIIGGEWLQADRPDFLWYKPRATSFKGKFSVLNEVYAAGVGSLRYPEPIPSGTLIPTATPAPVSRNVNCMEKRYGDLKKICVGEYVVLNGTIGAKITGVSVSEFQYNNTYVSTTFKYEQVNSPATKGTVTITTSSISAAVAEGINSVSFLGATFKPTDLVVNNLRVASLTKVFQTSVGVFGIAKFTDNNIQEFFQFNENTYTAQDFSNQYIDPVKWKSDSVAATSTSRANECFTYNAGSNGLIVGSCASENSVLDINPLGSSGNVALRFKNKPNMCISIDKNTMAAAEIKVCNSSRNNIEEFKIDSTNKRITFMKDGVTYNLDDFAQVTFDTSCTTIINNNSSTICVGAYVMLNGSIGVKITSVKRTEIPNNHNHISTLFTYEQINSPATKGIVTINSGVATASVTEGIASTTYLGLSFKINEDVVHNLRRGTLSKLFTTPAGIFGVVKFTDADKIEIFQFNETTYPAKDFDSYYIQADKWTADSIATTLTGIPGACFGNESGTKGLIFGGGLCGTASSVMEINKLGTSGNVALRFQNRPGECLAIDKNTLTVASLSPCNSPRNYIEEFKLDSAANRITFINNGTTYNLHDFATVKLDANNWKKDAAISSLRAKFGWCFTSVTGDNKLYSTSGSACDRPESTLEINRVGASSAFSLRFQNRPNECILINKNNLQSAELGSCNTVNVVNLFKLDEANKQITFTNSGVTSALQNATTIIYAADGFATDPSFSMLEDDWGWCVRHWVGYNWLYTSKSGCSTAESKLQVNRVGNRNPVQLRFANRTNDCIAVRNDRVNGGGLELVSCNEKSGNYIKEFNIDPANKRITFTYNGTAYVVYEGGAFLRTWAYVYSKPMSSFGTGRYTWYKFRN